MLTHQMCILIKQLNWGDPVYVVFEKTSLALGAVFNGHLGFISFCTEKRLFPLVAN